MSVGAAQLEAIKTKVEYFYHVQDVNCAKTTMLALSELYNFELNPQVVQAGAAMNGAGRYHAQCGLVEGALMFIGVFFNSLGQCDETIVKIAHRFASGFEKEFGSLSCRDLRPGGFKKGDPKHMCAELTVRTMHFTCAFINAELNSKAGFALKNMSDSDK